MIKEGDKESVCVKNEGRVMHSNLRISINQDDGGAIMIALLQMKVDAKVRVGGRIHRIKVNDRLSYLIFISSFYFSSTVYRHSVFCRYVSSLALV